MPTRRRVHGLLLAPLLALQVLAITAAPAAGACALTWTSQITDSKSITADLGTYTSTAKYRLEFNTCNLGVYTRINLQTYINKYAITRGIFPNYIDYQGAVLKNCSQLTAAQCVLYPGTTVSIDSRVYNHTAHGTYTRTTNPNNYFAYSSYAAIWDYWTTSGDPWYERFVFQFRRNSIAHG